MGIAIAGACLILVAVIAFSIIIVVAIVNAARHKKKKYGIKILLCGAAFIAGFALVAVAPIPPETMKEVTEASRVERSTTQKAKSETKSEKSETPQIQTDSKPQSESTRDNSKSESKPTESKTETEPTATTEPQKPTEKPKAKTDKSKKTKKEKTESATSESDKSEQIDTSVSFADIYREFKANELRAKDEFDGNRYQITGKINWIETGGLSNLTGGATLTMETEVDGTIVVYYAEFERAQEEKLKQVNEGDIITFVGRCSGGNFLDCELQ